MKAILEFNINDPYEKEVYMRAIKSTDLAGALWSIREEFFRIMKSDSNVSIEDLSLFFNNLLVEYNINFEEIYT